MASFKINGKDFATQTGTGEPNLMSNVVFPAGHILKVISTQSNARSGYSNLQYNSWQDLLSLAITPSATSSKVLVTASIACGVDNYGCSFRILQDGSTVSDHIGLSASSGSRTPITFSTIPYSVNDDEVATASYTGLFSPSSTGAVTYKVQGAGRAVSWSWNRGEDATDTSDRADAVSTLTLMEIKG
tara:strand:- start:3856 stop:4416 length:561 start_codon:yes stop_codon:yes gene_type:complete